MNEKNDFVILFRVDEKPKNCNWIKQRFFAFLNEGPIN